MGFKLCQANYCISRFLCLNCVCHRLNVSKFYTSIHKYAYAHLAQLAKYIYSRTDLEPTVSLPISKCFSKRAKSSYGVFLIENFNSFCIKASHKSEMCFVEKLVREIYCSCINFTL